MGQKLLMVVLVRDQCLKQSGFSVIYHGVPRQQQLLVVDGKNLGRS